MQQLVELQEENIALRKEGFCGQPNVSHVRKLEQPTIEPDATDGD